MKDSLTFISALLILSVLTLCYVSSSLAQPSNKGTAKDQIDNNVRLSKLMKELRSTVTTLRKERQAYYSGRQDDDQEIQGLRIQIQALSATQAELVSDGEDIAEDMKAINNDGERLQTSLSDYQNGEDELSKHVLSYVKRLREQVKNGIPFRQEKRTAKLNAIANEINATEQPDIAEACNQLWSFCKDELRLSVTSETYRDTIRLGDGREPHAEFVRVGKIILTFTTEDGKGAGVWLSGSEDATATGWVYNLSNAFLHSIQKAIKIHKMQHPPEMINFPISFSPENVHLYQDSSKPPELRERNKHKKEKPMKQDKE